MQDSTNLRKRPAPGASPLLPQQPAMQQQQQQQYQYQQYPNADFNNFNFAPSLQPDAAYNDTSAFDGNNLAYSFNTAQQPLYGSNIAPAQSTDLVRRARDQQLAPYPTQQEQWNGQGNVNSPRDDEDEQDLELKAQLAKKDAQSKRKQIPPFVQKLSSFLDSSHTDLIRWSDDGRSFIVLDEDEFARTLIPELFKHNNYASFVRQLNMYGFHKTVNITDGSLRQSEKARKGVKPPSMYSHPYFRKNRPDLLWLIQKPAGTKSTKRKRDGKDLYDSDEGSPIPESGGLPQQLSAPGSTSQELAQLPRNEFAAVRRELQNLQQQQKFISTMITQLKEQNDQFYRQATAFQALHDRHENSINAILTFLATFYNRSLEGQNAQNLVNMFANAMPHPQPQQGSVVEEYNDTGTPTPSNNQIQKFVKRPPLLLPGPTASNNTQNLQPGSAVTEPSSARASASPPNDRGSISSVSPAEHARPQSAASPRTPNLLDQTAPESNDQMMNLINNVNASTSTAASTPNANNNNNNSTSAVQSAVDMNSIVDRIKQNNSPLTAQQREEMVASLSQNGNNGADNTSNSNALSANSANPAAFREHIDASRTTLDYLQQLQKQQDAKVQELNRRLQPLSPTGTIPGLHEWGQEQDPFDQFVGGPGDYDASNFINFDDPAPWETGDGDGNFDFDFGGQDGGASGGWNGLDGDGGDMFGAATGDMHSSEGGRHLPPEPGVDNLGATDLDPADGHDRERVKSLDSSATSPAGTEGEPPEPSNKRQRRS